MVALQRGRTESSLQNTGRVNKRGKSSRPAVLPRGWLRSDCRPLVREAVLTDLKTADKPETRLVSFPSVRSSAGRRASLKSCVQSAAAFYESAYWTESLLLVRSPGWYNIQTSEQKNRTQELVQVNLRGASRYLF